MRVMTFLTQHFTSFLVVLLHVTYIPSLHLSLFYGSGKWSFAEAVQSTSVRRDVGDRGASGMQQQRNDSVRGLPSLIALRCPHAHMTAMSNFTDDNGRVWLACEDFTTPSGNIAFVTELAPPPPTADNNTGVVAAEQLAPTGRVVWLPKTHEPYTQGAEDDFYLGLGKASVLSQAKSRDVLGATLLSCNHSTVPGVACFTWKNVERALPPIRRNGPGGHWPSWEGCSGVRSFVGSRDTSTDATFSDYGEDCSHNGFPSALGQLLPGYSVINYTAVNGGEGAIFNWTQYVNFTAVADGLVGKTLPVLVLYFPILPDNPYHSFPKGHGRYWSMVATPIADAGGKREQQVWFRFTQVDCASRNAHTGYGEGPTCKPTSSQVWDTFCKSVLTCTLEIILCGAIMPEQHACTALAKASNYYALPLIHTYIFICIYLYVSVYIYM